MSDTINYRSAMLATELTPRATRQAIQEIGHTLMDVELDHAVRPYVAEYVGHLIGYAADVDEVVSETGELTKKQFGETLFCTREYMRNEHGLPEAAGTNYPRAPRDLEAAYCSEEATDMVFTLATQVYKQQNGLI